MKKEPRKQATAISASQCDHMGAGDASGIFPFCAGIGRRHASKSGQSMIPSRHGMRRRLRAAEREDGTYGRDYVFKDFQSA